MMVQQESYQEYFHLNLKEKGLPRAQKNILLPTLELFLFSMRSGSKGLPPPGWQVDQVQDLDWVGDVMMQKVSIMDL